MAAIPHGERACGLAELSPEFRLLPELISPGDEGKKKGTADLSTIPLLAPPCCGGGSASTARCQPRSLV